MQHRDRIGYFQSGSIGFPVICCQRSTDRFYLYLLLKPPNVLASMSREQNVSGHLIVHPESQSIFFRSLSPSAAVMQHRDRIGYFQSGSIGFPVICCQRSTDRFYLYLLLKPPSVLASTSRERNVSGHLIVHPESQPISYANYGWLMPDFRRPISIVNFYKSVRGSRLPGISS